MLLRQSVGHGPAIQAILLATYRALSLLPRSHLPSNFHIPSLALPALSTTVSTTSVPQNLPSAALDTPPSLQSRNAQQLTIISVPASPFNSRPGSPNIPHLPPISVPLFTYVWLGLAGISTKTDAKAFMPYVAEGLCVDEARAKITNGKLESLVHVKPVD
jgi:hypothetical protein